MSYRTRGGEPRTPGAPLGTPGAQGAVFRVRERPELAMKLWSAPTPADAERLRAQIAHPFPTQVSGWKVMIAWPHEELIDDQGRTVGFTMPIAKGVEPKKLFNLVTRHEREKFADNLRFDVLMQVGALVNAGIAHAHDHGVVIGDVNELNALVSADGWLTVIDTDSMQFTTRDGRCHFTPYHREEYLAPEFAGVDLRRVPRTAAADDHAGAVLAFQLCMYGFHPYDAVENAAANGRDQNARARAGLFAYAGAHKTVAPPPGAPSFDVVPDSVARLFEQTFTHGALAPAQRVDARTLATVMIGALGELASCSGRRVHRYPRSRGGCPWCEWEARHRLYGQAPGRTAAPRTRRAAHRAAPAPAPARRSAPLWIRNAGRISAASVAALVLVGILVLVLGGPESPGATTAAAPMTTPIAHVATPTADPTIEPTATATATATAAAATPEPAAAVRAHLEALAGGRPEDAWTWLDPRWRATHPGWVANRRAGAPTIRRLVIGRPSGTGREVWMPISFIARDHRASAGSDRLCRAFRGEVQARRTGDGWKYAPGNRLTGHVIPSDRKGCA